MATKKAGSKKGKTAPAKAAVAAKTSKKAAPAKKAAAKKSAANKSAPNKSAAKKSAGSKQKNVTGFKTKLATAVALDALEMMFVPESPMASMAATVNEPPIDRDPAKLDPEFRVRLEKVLATCSAEGIPFKFHEGFRTVERQQWLYGQGRPNAPFGRPGNIVTNRDGVKKLSNHQGNGLQGSGCAADCYPLNAQGKVTLKAPDKTWKRYAEIAEANGLIAGYRWVQPHDPPHIELVR